MQIIWSQISVDCSPELFQLQSVTATGSACCCWRCSAHSVSPISVATYSVNYCAMSWPDFTTIVPATACRQGSYVETYSRSILSTVHSARQGAGSQRARARSFSPQQRGDVRAVAAAGRPPPAPRHATIVHSHSAPFFLGL